MEQIFEIASKVSTPLALAGLFAAAFFLVVRQLIARDLFPQLTKKYSAELLTLIINRLGGAHQVALAHEMTTRTDEARLWWQ